MKIRTLLLVIVLVAIATFVALNWSAFMTPTTLSLGVAAIQAPLGVVMLGLLVLFTALFLVFVIYSKTSGFFKERLHAREMHATQELADNAETSRFTELREHVDAGLNRQAGLYSESTVAVMARMDQLEADFRSRINELGKAFATNEGPSQFTKPEKRG
jgi:hypothetical protein